MRKCFIIAFVNYLAEYLACPHFELAWANLARRWSKFILGVKILKIWRSHLGGSPTCHPPIQTGTSPFWYLHSLKLWILCVLQAKYRKLKIEKKRKMISKSDIINIAIRKTVKVCSKTANVFLSTSVFTEIYLFKFDHFLPKFCLHNCSHVTKRPQNCYVQSFYTGWLKSN